MNKPVMTMPLHLVKDVNMTEVYVIDYNSNKIADTEIKLSPSTTHEEILAYIDKIYDIKNNGVIREPRIAIVDNANNIRLRISFKDFRRLAFIKSLHFIYSVNSIASELFDPVLKNYKRVLGVDGAKEINEFTNSVVELIDIEGENILSNIIIIITKLKVFMDVINSLRDLIDEIYGTTIWTDSSDFLITLRNGKYIKLTMNGFEAIFGSFNLEHLLGDIYEE